MDYSWTGSDQPFLDEASFLEFGNVHIGACGGCTIKGANKNEDALFVLQDEERTWVFAALLDAHNSSQSAELVIGLLNNHKNNLMTILNSKDAFVELEPFLVGLLSDDKFREKCRTVTGEASCLFCYQRAGYLWWLSIGDCMAFLFHPDLAKFNQYGLNQRQFYEWVGQVNTFEQPVPCYTSGRRQLREGANYIILMTDGVLDTEDEFYANPCHLYETITQADQIQEGLKQVMNHLIVQGVRDSATIVCWEYINREQGLNPSD